MSSKVAALYIRVSTEDQTELSPDAQKRLLLDYAQKNDMIVSGDFIFTESVSGRHAQKRPEFQKMIALAKQPSHPIDDPGVEIQSFCPQSGRVHCLQEHAQERQCGCDQCV